MAVVRTLDDPNAAWIHIFAARRANTLKSRYKWLELHRGYLFPKSVKDAIDYMQHRAEDGWGRTVPETFSVALGMEQVLGAELCEDAAPRKPAEMYTVAIVIALGLTVVDETEPIFARALSWVVLVMNLGCNAFQSVLSCPIMASSSYLGSQKQQGPTRLPEPYHEDEAIQKLCDAAESNGANPNRIRKRHTVLGDWSGNHSLGGIDPTLEVAEGDWPNVMDEAEGDASLSEKVSMLAQGITQPA